MTIDFLNQLRTAHEEGRFAAFICESAESGLLFKVMPQLHGLDRVPQYPRWHPEGDVWTHTLLVIQHLPPSASFALSLAALLHDVGKASTTLTLETGAISARGHEGVSEKISHLILDALGADEQLKKEVTFLVRHHMTAHNRDANVRTLRRLVLEGGRELVDQLLQHGVADVSGGCQDFADCKRLRSLFDQMGDVKEKPHGVLSGDEVMALTGLEPGPEVGRLLHALDSLGEIDRETAIAYIRNARKSWKNI